MAFRLDFERLDLRSTLDLAIGMEEDEQLRYRELAVSVDDPSAAAFFRTLGDQESGHRRRLEARRAVLFRHATPHFDTSLDESDAEEGDPISERQALELSLHAEARVWRFYSDAIPHVKDDDVRASFREILQESAAHHAAVRKKLDGLLADGGDPSGS